MYITLATVIIGLYLYLAARAISGAWRARADETYKHREREKWRVRHAAAAAYRERMRAARKTTF